MRSRRARHMAKIIMLEAENIIDDLSKGDLGFALEGLEKLRVQQNNLEEELYEMESR